MTPKIYDPGPYSGTLFDYEKEAEYEQLRAKKKQEAEQRIMRTNTIGDALSILMESVGGAAGATINRRPPNPWLIKASARYDQIGDQLEGKMDRIRMTDLSMREKDLGYQLGEQSKQAGWAREDQQIKDTRTFQEKQAEKQQAWSDTNREDTQAFSAEQDKTNFQQQKELETLRTKNQYAQERFRTDENIRQSNAIHDYQMKAVDRSDRSKKILKTDIPFQIPGTTQVIYLGEEEVAEMAHSLIQESKASGKLITDPALKAISRNEMVKPESLIESIKQNWGQVKFVLPEYAKERPVQLTPQQKRYNEYQQQVNEINNDPQLSPRQKVKQKNKLADQYKDVSSGVSQGLQVKEQHKGELNNLLNMNTNPEAKRSAIYNYLVKAGYDKAQAKAFAEYVYSNITAQ